MVNSFDMYEIKKRILDAKHSKHNVDYILIGF